MGVGEGVRRGLGSFFRCCVVEGVGLGGGSVVVVSSGGGKKNKKWKGGKENIGPKGVVWPTTTSEMKQSNSLPSLLLSMILLPPPPLSPLQPPTPPQHYSTHLQSYVGERDGAGERRAGSGVAGSAAFNYRISNS